MKAAQCSYWDLRHLGVIAAASFLWLRAPSDAVTWQPPDPNSAAFQHLRPGRSIDAARFNGVTATASTAWLSSIQAVEKPKPNDDDSSGRKTLKEEGAVAIARDSSIDSEAWSPLRPFLVGTEEGGEELPSWVITNDPLSLLVGATPAWISHGRGNGSGSGSDRDRSPSNALQGMEGTLRRFLPILLKAAKGHWRGRLSACFALVDAAQLSLLDSAADTAAVVEAVEHVMACVQQRNFGIQGRCALLRGLARLLSVAAWLRESAWAATAQAFASFPAVRSACDVVLELGGEEGLEQWLETADGGGEAGGKRQRIEGSIAPQEGKSSEGEGMTRLHRGALWDVQGDTLIAAIQCLVAALPSQCGVTKEGKKYEEWQQHAASVAKLCTNVAVSHGIWHVRLRAWRVLAG